MNIVSTSLLPALLITITACGSETLVAVRNTLPNASSIKVRDAANSSSSEVDFGQVASGTTTGCEEIQYDSYAGVNVNATDNAENGTVDLKEGVANLIVVYEDGTEPTSEQPDGLCD